MSNRPNLPESSSFLSRTLMIGGGVLIVVLLVAALLLFNLGQRQGRILGDEERQATAEAQATMTAIIVAALAQPTATPLPPSETPAPPPTETSVVVVVGAGTSTPVPVPSETATGTPPPAETPTPLPTDTSVPATATGTPILTDTPTTTVIEVTPLPTNTVSPTPPPTPTIVVQLPSVVPTATPSPTLTPVPTLTHTPTSTPRPPVTEEDLAAAEQSGLSLPAVRFVRLGADAISALSGRAPDEVAAALEALAESEELLFSSLAYMELTGDRWAALAVPRTLEGQPLPTLFWQSGEADGTVRGQALFPLLAEAPDANPLLTGIAQGVIQGDEAGRTTVLLVERTALNGTVTVYALTAPPDDLFRWVWRSSDEPEWTAQPDGLQLQLVLGDGEMPPEIAVVSLLPDDAALRNRLDAPDFFVERPPFAQQMIQARWVPAFVPVGGQTDATRLIYRLANAALLPTPLTTLSQFLAEIEMGNFDSAAARTTVPTLVATAGELGLDEPGDWIGLYLDPDSGTVLPTGATSTRLRFFDNADRTRTFTAYFAEDPQGLYLISALEAAPDYVASDLVTPAPTWTPVPTATSTASATATVTETATETASPTATDEPTATPTETEMPTATATATATETDTPLPTASATATETATLLPTATATATPEPTATATASATPTETETAIPTATETPLPTATASATATATPEPTETPTASATPTETETTIPTATETASPTATDEPTATPTETEMPTATATATASETATPEPTETPTASATPTETETATETASPTATDEPTATPTETEAPTATATATASETVTDEPTATATRTPRPTRTATATATATASATETATPTPEATGTPTETDTPTETATPTATSLFPAEIDLTDPNVITASVVLSPARLRAAPTTDADILARLPEGATVVLGGMTEDEVWVLVKVVDPVLAEEGVADVGDEGWIALQLLQPSGDLASLPRFDLEGVPLPGDVEEEATETPEVTATTEETPTAGEEPGDEEPGDEEVTATPTPDDSDPVEETSPLPSVVPTATSLFPAEIDLTDPDVITASVVLAPARLRTAPTTDAEVLATLPEGATVVLGGMTEDEVWVLVKVVDPTVEEGDIAEGSTEEDGTEGWMALQLLQPSGDLASLARFDLEGIPLPGEVEAEATETPEATATPEETVSVDEEPAGQEPGDEEPGDEEATATPTPEGGDPAEETIPLPSVVPTATPIVEEDATVAELPAVAQDERVVTVTGEAIPPNPLEPIPVVGEDGAAYALLVDPDRSDQVEIWSGILGEEEGRWLPARAELLWPGTRVYVSGELAEDGETILVERARIAAAPPDWNRLRLFTVPRYATAIARDEAMSLLDVREEPGIALLETDGDFTQIWASGQEVVAIEGETGGAVIPSSNIASGISSFVYIRNDGIMVEVTAQPFYTLRGIAGDGGGDLWWIEAPQVGLDHWQLWYYDSEAQSLILAAQQPLAIFGGEEGTLLQPTLIDVRTTAEGLALLLETSDVANGQINAGVYRLLVNAGEITSIVQLLPAGGYRAPLRVSPDGAYLAYFTYDPDHPSLTESFVQPPNRLWVLPLNEPAEAATSEAEATEPAPGETEIAEPEAAEPGETEPSEAAPTETEPADTEPEGTEPVAEETPAPEVVEPGAEEGAETTTAPDQPAAILVYETETRFEFLPPNLSWRADDELILARSRFAPNGVFALERFGIVHATLAGDAVVTVPYLLPAETVLEDFAVCQAEGGIMLAISDKESAGSWLSAWPITAEPDPLVELPVHITRIHACWQIPR